MTSAERLARNEALFREVNEVIAELSASFADPTGHHPFVCECAYVDCSEQLPLTLAEYQRLRERDNCFAVKPGHEMSPAVEQVIGEHCEYIVVQKLVDPD